MSANSVPPSAVGTDDGTPAAADHRLRPIQDSLLAIEAALTAARPFEAAELADWAELLLELNSDLEEASDDDGMTTAEWEELSSRIGVCQRQVKALLEVTDPAAAAPHLTMAAATARDGDGGPSE